MKLFEQNRLIGVVVSFHPFFLNKIKREMNWTQLGIHYPHPPPRSELSPSFTLLSFPCFFSVSPFSLEPGKPICFYYQLQKRQCALFWQRHHASISLLSTWCNFFFFLFISVFFSSLNWQTSLVTAFFCFLLCANAVRKTCTVYIWFKKNQCVGFLFFSLPEGLCVRKDSEQQQQQMPLVVSCLINQGRIVSFSFFSLLFLIRKQFCFAWLKRKRYSCFSFLFFFFDYFNKLLLLPSLAGDVFSCVHSFKWVIVLSGNSDHKWELQETGILVFPLFPKFFLTQVIYKHTCSACILSVS